MHRAALKQTVSDNFRRSRRAGGLSQEAFGRLIGWDRTRVVKAESGRTLATPETIELWAENTGRDPFWFHVPHDDDLEDDEIGAVA